MKESVALQREQAIDGDEQAVAELAQLCAVDAEAAPWWIAERRFDIVLGSELRALAEPDLAPRVMALIQARPTEVRRRIAGRIRHRVPSRRRGRSRRSVLLLVASTAVAACVMAALVLGRPTVAAVGTDGAGQPVLRGEVRMPTVTFLDGTVVRVASESRLSILDAPDGAGLHAKLLRLTTGEVLVEASAQPPGLPLRILTPQAEVEVVGTRFRVAVAEETSLQVMEGTVAIATTHQRLLVGPGQEAVTSSDGAVRLVSGPTSPPYRDRQYDLHLEAKQAPTPLLAVGFALADPTDSARLALSGAKMEDPCFGVVLIGTDQQPLPVVRASSRLSFRAYLDAPVARAVEVWVRTSTGQDHWSRLDLLPARRWTLFQIDLAEVPKSLGVPAGSLLSRLCIFINRAEPVDGGGAELLVNDIDITSDLP